jgi:hypothetical protein
MFSDKTIKKIVKFFSKKPMVIEGANGSIGLSILSVLKEYKIYPTPLILTTLKSDLDNDWSQYNRKIIHFKNFNLDRSIKKNTIKKLKSPNIFFCSGYGRPSIFLKNPKSTISSNVSDLMLYCDIKKINSFSYMSSSELYSGLDSSTNEDSLLPTTPQHSRGIYIESKRLGEAIVENIIGKNCNRYASYRVALAFPPKLLKNDNRVLSDLINNSIRTGVVTLHGGAKFIRQYQYGPNCVKKIFGSIVQGKSCLYNNGGSHIISLRKLASVIGKILNLKVKIKKTNNKNLSAPRNVLIDSTLIDYESRYLHKYELSFEEYLSDMIKKKNV